MRYSNLYLALSSFIFISTLTGCGGGSFDTPTTSNLIAQPSAAVVVPNSGTGGTANGTSSGTTGTAGATNPTTPSVELDVLTAPAHGFALSGVSLNISEKDKDGNSVRKNGEVIDKTSNYYRQALKSEELQALDSTFALPKITLPNGKKVDVKSENYIFGFGKIHPNAAKNLGDYEHIRFGYVQADADISERAGEAFQGSATAAFYHGERPASQLPSSNDVKYTGQWLYLSDVKDRRADGVVEGAEGGSGLTIYKLREYGDYSGNGQETSANHFNHDNNVGKHLNTPATYTANFADKTFTGVLSYNENPTDASKSKDKPIYQIDAKIVGNRFIGSATSQVDKNDTSQATRLERALFSANASNRLEGGFYGDQAQELAGKFLADDDSMFVVFGGKQDASKLATVSEQATAGFVVNTPTSQQVKNGELAGYTPLSLELLSTTSLDEQEQALDAQLEAKTISQEQYDQQLAALLQQRVYVEQQIALQEQYGVVSLIEKLATLTAEEKKINVDLDTLYDDDEENDAQIDENEAYERLGTLATDIENIKNKLQAKVQEHEQAIAGKILSDVKVQNLGVFGDVTRLVFAGKVFEINSQDASELLKKYYPNAEIAVNDKTKVRTLVLNKNEQGTIVEDISVCCDNLSYVKFGRVRVQDEQGTISPSYYVQGNVTPQSAMPSEGQAKYVGSWSGFITAKKETTEAQRLNYGFGNSIERTALYSPDMGASNERSKAIFNVNFADKNLTGTLHDTQGLSVFDIQATIQGSAFTGTASGSNINAFDGVGNMGASAFGTVNIENAQVVGQFFGDQAQELGGTLHYNSSENGLNSGVRAGAVFGAGKVEQGTQTK